jgi:hypothetical protein
MPSLPRRATCLPRTGGAVQFPEEVPPRNRFGSRKTGLINHWPVDRGPAKARPESASCVSMSIPPQSFGDDADVARLMHDELLTFVWHSNGA